MFFVIQRNKIITWLVSGFAILLLIIIGLSYFQANQNSNTPEMINGIIVPPEPPVGLNKSTLAGVDVNNNGVRDDVERIMAKKFGGTTDYPFAMAYARHYQIKITAPTPKNRNDALIESGKEVCTVEGASDAVHNLKMRDIMETTPERNLAIRAYNDVLEGYLATELPPCTQ